MVLNFYFRLRTRFLKEVKFKTGAIAMEVSGRMKFIVVLDVKGRLLLLRLNGEFYGSIVNKNFTFT